jgi:thiamine phosphate synthase YjbQ (UPF0047 family)
VETTEISKIRDELTSCNGACVRNEESRAASVFINDDGPDLHEDYARWLEELAPFDPSPERYYQKRQVMGQEVVVAVTGGKLEFGPSERIFYSEFDGLIPPVGRYHACDICGTRDAIC